MSYYVCLILTIILLDRGGCEKFRKVFDIGFGLGDMCKIRHDKTSKLTFKVDMICKSVFVILLRVPVNSRKYIYVNVSVVTLPTPIVH